MVKYESLSITWRRVTWSSSLLPSFYKKQNNNKEKSRREANYVNESLKVCELSQKMKYFNFEIKTTFYIFLKSSQIVKILSKLSPTVNFSFKY